MLRRADVERYLGKVVKIFFIQNDNEDFNIGVLKDVSDTSVLIASRTGRLTTIPYVHHICKN